MGPMSKPIWAQVELPTYFLCMGNDWAKMGPSFGAVWVRDTRQHPEKSVYNVSAQRAIR